MNIRKIGDGYELDIPFQAKVTIKGGSVVVEPIPESRPNVSEPRITRNEESTDLAAQAREMNTALATICKILEHNSGRFQRVRTPCDKSPVVLFDVPPVYKARFVVRA